MIKHWFSDVRAFRHNPLDLILSRGIGSDQPFIPLALGPRPIVLLRDPAAIKPLLNLSEELSDKGRLVHKLKAVLGGSTLTLSGEGHRARRAVLHERLSRGVATSYVPEMVATIRATCLALSKQQRVRADIVGGSLAIRLICVALFGHRVLTQADEMVVMKAVNALEENLQSEMFRFLPRSPWQKRKDERVRKEALHAISFIISKVRSTAGESSVLKALDKLALSDIEIRDEIATMIIAGYHTTGAAISWILYYLCTQPEAAEAVRRECIHICGEDGELQAQKLPQATVSLAFVKEVLRLYPSAWWTTREMKQAATVSGVSLAKGTTVIVSPWLHHRDPQEFKSPSAFSLDRMHGGPAYLPFGTGPRACVGMGVALLELQLIALEFAASLQLHALPDLPVPPIAAGITLSAPHFEFSTEVRELASRENARAA